jgi:hypothetical protein
MWVQPAGHFHVNPLSFPKEKHDPSAIGLSCFRKKKKQKQHRSIHISCFFIGLLFVSKKWIKMVIIPNSKSYHHSPPFFGGS